MEKPSIKQGTYQDLDPKSVSNFQILTADISLNIARTDLYQPPKLPQFCQDYNFSIQNYHYEKKIDVKRQKKHDRFWIKIQEFSQNRINNPAYLLVYE